MSKTARHTASTETPSGTPLLFLVISVVAIVGGMYSAYKMRWLNDDIFITLRYVDNWLDGRGLVYNAGEFVEGYTHFSWLLIIAFFQRLKFNPTEIVQWMGLISYAGILITAAAISLQSGEKRTAMFPLTAVVLSIHFEAKVWATGGLETSMFTFLVLLSVFILCFWNTVERRRLIAAGSCMTLLVLTRPDGVLFYVSMLTFVLARSYLSGRQSKELLKEALLFNAAAVVVLIPYVLWKYFYYGHLLPNTYYAKSGGLSNYGQGFFYVYTYFRGYPSSLLALGGLMVLAQAYRTSKAESLFSRLKETIIRPGTGSVILILGSTVIYLVFFVARVGGDFMYARFLHPLIPLFYITAEISARSILREKKNILWGVLVFIPLLVFYEKSLRDQLFIEPSGERKGAFAMEGITDEYWYWSQTETFNGINPIQANALIGTQLEQYFRGTKVQVLLRGQASLAYYAKFYQCIENFGLTDSYIAHLPIATRNRPGHEKAAPLDYLVKRGVHFVFFRSPYDTASYRFVNFKLGSGFGRAEMFIYDRELMNHLGRNFPGNVLFTDFESYLDQYLGSVKTRKKDEVRRDFERFKDFYFLHNPDPGREQRFLAFLGG